MDGRNRGTCGNRWMVGIGGTGGNRWMVGIRALIGGRNRGHWWK